MMDSSNPARSKFFEPGRVPKKWFNVCDILTDAMLKTLLLLSALSTLACETAAFSQLVGDPQRIFIESSKDGVITAHLIVKNGRGPTFTAACESRIVDSFQMSVQKSTECHLADDHSNQEIGHEAGSLQDGKIRGDSTRQQGVIVLMQEKDGKWIVEFYRIS